MLPFRRLMSVLTSGGAAWTPASLFPANTGGWWTGDDLSYMRSLYDGSGGVPAVGDRVGQLLDRSGNGNHLIQTTSGTRPYAQSGYIAFPSIIGAANRPKLFKSSIGGTTQSMTGLLVADITGIPDANIPFDWDSTNSGNAFELTACYSATNGQFRFITSGGFVNSALKWTSQKLYIAWRGSATGFEMWINGQQYTRTALTSLSLGQLMLGSGGGGGPTKMRFYDLVAIPAALGDAEFTSLVAYGARRADRSAETSDILLARGDSLTSGQGSALVAPWMFRSGQMTNAKRYNYGLEGDYAFAPSTSAAALVSNYPVGAGRNVAVVWLGTNDIHGAARTGAQTETAIATHCSALRAAGYKVVVCTLQDFSGGFGTPIAACNTALRANYTTYADALADLADRSELSDNTNTTYYSSDGVHLIDAGYAVVAAVVDAAIASIP